MIPISSFSLGSGNDRNDTASVSHFSDPVVKMPLGFIDQQSAVQPIYFGKPLESGIAANKTNGGSLVSVRHQ